MLREAASPLRVCDVQTQNEVTLKPGTAIATYRIHRSTAEETARGADAYLMDFQVGDRHYRCPLHRFQSRTQVVESMCLEEQPVRAKMAV
jgi:hypothetical protein